MAVAKSKITYQQSTIVNQTERSNDLLNSSTREELLTIDNSDC